MPDPLGLTLGSPTVRRARPLLFESVFTFADAHFRTCSSSANSGRRPTLLEHLATHDPLTGLANRRRFRDEAGRAIWNAEAGAVLLIDLDRFKEVNDTLGHHTGDQLLVEVAEPSPLSRSATTV